MRSPSRQPALVARLLSTGPNRAACAVAAACVALVATAAAAQAPPGHTAQATPPIPAAGEGPGGRVALTRWTFSLDAADRGLARGWQRGGFSGHTVSVASAIDPGAIKGAAGTRNYEGSVAWYRTTFTAPHSGVYALTFDSANFQANVWVDGHALVAHRGSYLPFEGRATLAAGTHTVVVRVDWRDPARQSTEGFHRTWFNWGGLDGEVTVRPIGSSELVEPTVQTTLQPDSASAESAIVRLSVQVRNDAGPARAFAPAGTLTHGEQTVPIAFPPQTVAHGQTATLTTTVTVAQPALWSPSAPSLYALKLTAGGASPGGGGAPGGQGGGASPAGGGDSGAQEGGGGESSGEEGSYTAHVGLRELTWHGARVYLNGERLRLHGASLQEDAAGHGDALTGGDENTLVSELKAIGANAVRSQHPLYPGLLEKLDAAGILVWQGIGPVEGAGNWYSDTPSLLAAAEAQARSAVLASELHPSIVTWNLVDEIADNGHDGDEVHYVESLARWLHAHDPTRMVAVDVWGDHPPTHAGPLYAGVDAVAETDYTGWYDNPQDTPAQQDSEMRARLAAMQRTFAGKVLVVSEFGAESNTLNPPGAPGSDSFQANLLARHIGVYEGDEDLSGMLVWDLRDYPLVPTFEGGSIHSKLPHLRLIEGLNQKGLFTYSGAPKIAVGVVARLFGALPRD
jgi:Glycosyl hydrolases family 2, TIM barrel domain/Glycosyl hydrolases family 2, sugar binding domain/Glycosyl hydrolases family 2